MHRPSYEVLKVTDALYFTFCDGMQAEQGHSDHIRTYPHTCVPPKIQKIKHFIFFI